MTEPRDTPIDQFVARIRRERVEAGLSPVITDPAVYRLLDGIMANRAGRADDAA